MERHVFGNCKKLSSIAVPSSVTSIDQAAFFGCSSLNDESTIHLDGFSSLYTAAMLVEWTKYYTYHGNRIEEIPTSVPDVKVAENVDSVHVEAFKDREGIKSVCFSSSVATIEESAFSGCKDLKRIEFADPGTVEITLECCTEGSIDVTLGCEQSSVPVSVDNSIPCSSGAGSGFLVKFTFNVDVVGIPYFIDLSGVRSGGC